jgi:hypothetical protein
MYSMSVEDWVFQSRDHAKDIQLSLMEKCSPRKGPTKEADNTCWSFVYQFLQVLRGFLHAAIYHYCFRVAQNKRSQSREKYWGSIELVDTKRSSRVSAMTSS